LHDQRAGKRRRHSRGRATDRHLVLVWRSVESDAENFDVSSRRIAGRIKGKNRHRPARTLTPDRKNISHCVVIIKRRLIVLINDAGEPAASIIEVADLLSGSAARKCENQTDRKKAINNQSKHYYSDPIIEAVVIFLNEVCFPLHSIIFSENLAPKWIR